MLSYKLLGALLIVAASTAAGYRLAGALRLRAHILQDLVYALQALETEVTTLLSPLPEAAARISQGARTQQVAHFFRIFGNKLRTGQESTHEIWVRTARQVLGSAGLAPEDLAAMERLGRHLGRSDRQDQLKHIARARADLEGAVQRAREQWETYGSLYKKLGITAGLIIVLLSW
ncbi:MAG: stage III sporulation protein AB [Firmicutes bacterium]|nr:stage III sporulation protein AB [Bacillota bacterium]